MPEFWEILKTGGSGVVPLLGLALWWLNRERDRLLEALKAKDLELTQERNQSRADAIIYAKAVERMQGKSSARTQTLTSLQAMPDLRQSKPPDSD